MTEKYVCLKPDLTIKNMFFEILKGELLSFCRGSYGVASFLGAHNCRKAPIQTKSLRPAQGQCYRRGGDGEKGHDGQQRAVPAGKSLIPEALATSALRISSTANLLEVLCSANMCQRPTHAAVSGGFRRPP